jgi:hypothetical protein
MALKTKEREDELEVSVMTADRANPMELCEDGMLDVRQLFSPRAHMERWLESLSNESFKRLLYPFPLCPR